MNLIQFEFNKKNNKFSNCYAFLAKLPYEFRFWANVCRTLQIGNLIFRIIYIFYYYFNCIINSEKSNLIYKIRLWVRLGKVTSFSFEFSLNICVYTSFCLYILIIWIYVCVYIYIYVFISFFILFLVVIACLYAFSMNEKKIITTTYYVVVIKHALLQKIHFDFFCFCYVYGLKKLQW